MKVHFNIAIVKENISFSKQLSFPYGNKCPCSETCGVHGRADNPQTRTLPGAMLEEWPEEKLQTNTTS